QYQRGDREPADPTLWLGVGQGHASNRSAVRGTGVARPAARAILREMGGASSEFEQDLDKPPANFVPLTPLSFIERAAAVYPQRLSVVHGAQRYTWKE